MNKLLRISIIFPVFFFLLLVPLQAAIAHTASYGYAKWHVSDLRAEWTLVVDSKSIMELGPIDEDRDGKLSYEEAAHGWQSYVRPYLEDKLNVHVNGEAAAYQLDSLSIVNGSELQMAFHLDSKWPITSFKVDYRLFFENSANQHQNISLFYLPDHPDSPIEHIFKADSQTWEGRSSDTSSGLERFIPFIMLGMEHILTGYDHILFLASLLVIGLSFRSAVSIITAFTAAHSITLILAALDIVHFNPRWIEIAIALTICYVAAENIWKREFRYRWGLTFCFGLIHGFGFANALAEIAIPKSHLAFCLIGFNLGVEAGQLLLMCAILPLIFAMSKFRRIPFRHVTTWVSAVILLFGLLWAIERGFGLAL